MRLHFGRRRPRTRQDASVGYRPGMSTSVEDIAADAERLSPDQRLTLAHKILSSVEPLGSREIEAAWDTEIRRRIGIYDSGNSVALPAPGVFAELDRRLRA